jgi:SWI/SNF related-matrix-associated actin-dependent regulator of chromatin subfamily C
MICGLVWFQQKIPGDKYSNAPELVLCIKCFTEGNYPTILSDKDFVKVDLINRLASQEPNQKPQKAPWQPEETLKLLDLIEKHGDNWEQILE